MKLNIRKTIELFDEKMPENSGHISGVIDLLGEELLVKIFAHYLESLKYHVKVYKETPKNGKKKGPRLDAWIDAKKGTKHFLYQAEIKNWSAYAIGGKTAALDIGDEELKQQARERFDQQLNEHFQTKKITIVNKVLIRMNPPHTAGTVKALVIYWWPISKDGINPFTSLRPNKILLKKLKSPANFKDVHIFSTSLYLRTLYKKKKYISISLPKMQRRQAMIEQIFV